MRQFIVIDAPSNLGLWPSGVESLGIALKSAGLMTQLGADYGGRLQPQPFVDVRDPKTMIRNGEAIRTDSQQIAEAVRKEIQDKCTPIVLGGDCSILIGAMLGLRQMGRYGLFFIDAHTDFYQPEIDPVGEVASMELAFITGRGPDVLANIDGLKPLVRDEDVVVFGYRDQAQQDEEGSPDIRQTAIHSYPLERIRQRGFEQAAQQALSHLSSDLDGFWIHLDADVLDDAIMPAVDYRILGGLQWEEMSALLQILFKTGRAVGITITIFNPTLDTDGRIAQQFTHHLVRGLTGNED
jgi:arginase